MSRNQQGTMSQLASDLNNLGLDPNTLKKLSMSGIREFIPPNTTSSGGDTTSGSSSPFPAYSSSNQHRLQPPTGGSYGGSPRGSPTPSSMSSMMPPNSNPGAASSAGGPNGGPQDMGDPSAISTYNDGGTTYFYSSDEVVSRILYFL